MAIIGYDYDLDVTKKPDTWADTGKDTVLTVGGALARGAGEIGQAVGAKEFAEGARDVERALETQLSPTGREVAKSSWIPTEEGQTSSWKHPVRSALHDVAGFAGDIPAILGGGAAGTAVGGPVGGFIGASAGGAGQGFGRAEYEARRRVEDMPVEEREKFQIYQETLSQTGDAQQATEALVKAFHPALAEALYTMAGGVGAGPLGSRLARPFASRIAQRIIEGHAPKVGRTMAVNIGEQGLAMGAQTGLEETGRQSGEIEAGARQGYDPLKIAIAGGKGALGGAVMGSGIGTYVTVKGGRDARLNRERSAEILERGLEGAFPDNPYVTPQPVPPTAPPKVGTAGSAVDPAQAAALSAATSTGGGGPARKADVQTISDDANVRGQQVGEQQGQQQAPPAEAGAGVTTEVTPPVTPPVEPPVAPPTTPVAQAAAPVAQAAAPTPRIEPWADFHNRVLREAPEGMQQQDLVQIYNAWKKDNPKEPRVGYGALETAVRKLYGDAQAAKAKAAKLERRQAAEAAALVKEQAKRDAAEAAAKATEPVVEPAKQPDQPVEAATKPVDQAPVEAAKVEGAKVEGAEPAKPKAGDQLTDERGTYTVVETVVSGKTYLGKKYTETVDATQTPAERKSKGERTKKADEATRGGKAVQETMAAAGDLMEKAKAEHAKLVQDTADARAKARAAGKPVVLKPIPTVDEIHARLLDEHNRGVKARQQFENAAEAKDTRVERKSKTEATEEVARSAATEHVEHLSDDHRTHEQEELDAAAQKDDVGGKRHKAREAVIRRAHAMVAMVEKKMGATIGGKAGSTKEEGGLKQNVLNALRDTKTMLDRWARRDEGTANTRKLRRDKLDQDFVDHLEDMAYLREQNFNEMGVRREDRSAQRTLSERAKGQASGGKKRGDIRTIDDEPVERAKPKKKLDEDEQIAREEHVDDAADDLDVADRDAAQQHGSEHRRSEDEPGGRRRERGEDVAEGFTEVDDPDAPLARKATTTVTLHNAATGTRRQHTVDVIHRAPGSKALQSAIDFFKEQFRNRHTEGLLRGGSGELLGAHYKHLAEWAERMRDAMPDVRTEVISDADWDVIARENFNRPGSEVEGMWVPEGTSGKVLIPTRMLGKDVNLATTLVHEYGHGATLRAYQLDAGYRAAVDSLYKAFVKEAGEIDPNHYAFESAKEFITEAHVDYNTFQAMSFRQAPPDVVAYVQGLPRPTRKMTMAQAFVGMIAKALGIKRPPMSMLDAYVRMNEHVLQRSADAGAFTQGTGQGTSQGTGRGAADAISPRIRIPTGQSIRHGFTEQARRMKAQGGTFTDRWKAVMLNMKSTTQIGQGMDYLFGKLTDTDPKAPLTKRALDLMPDKMRALMQGKSLSRVYVDLHQRQSGARERHLKDGGGEEISREGYRLERKYSQPDSSPDGNGTMWDYFARFVHDETGSGAHWGTKANDHLDPNNLDHAQALASIAEGQKRFNNLPADLKKRHSDGQAFTAKENKWMSDKLFDNTVDELTEAIRNEENKKAVKAPIFDRAGIDNFKNWLKDGRPDTHPQNDLYRNILAQGPAAQRLKDIRALTEIAGPYAVLMRRGDYHLRGFHELSDAPNQLRRMDPSGEVFDANNADHVARQHEFNKYEFADEGHIRSFVSDSDFKAQNTGEVLVNKATGKTERVKKPKKIPEVTDASGKVITPESYETNYGGKNESHATLAAANKARDAFIAANYDKRYQTTLQNRFAQFHQTATDLELSRRDMENTPGFKITEYGHRPFEKMEHVDDMGGEIRRIRDAMDKTASFKAMDASNQKLMHDLLSHQALRVLGGTRVQSRRLPRTNVLGHSNDLAHNMADYAYSTAGYGARLEFGPHIQRVTDAMKAEVVAKGADRDAFVRSAVMNEFERRQDQVGPPTDDGIMGRAINRLLQASYLKRLASPAYHIVNAQEPWMVGLPYIAGEYGMWKSAGYLARAYNAIGGRDIAWQGVKETGKAFASDVGMDYGGRIRDKFADGSGEQRMLDDMRDRRMIGGDAGMELSKLNQSGTNLVGRGMDRADHVSRQMGQAIESINRSVVALSAYWGAKEKYPHLSEAAIYEKVAETLDNTMGTYDRWNAPPIFNHPLGRVALQFHKYGQKQYYLLGKLIGGAAKGDHKLQNAAALGMMMGTHLIMAGALGMPTEPITMAINVANSAGLTDETSDTFNNAIRETLAAAFGKEIGQLTSMGVPHYFGVDFNSRVGMQQMLGPNGAPKSHKAEDIFAYYAKWLAGSGPAMVTEYLSGLADLSAGDYDKAAQKLMPFKVLGDGAKAAMGMTTGKLSEAGRQQSDKMTAGEGFTQSLGFAPSRLKEAAAAKQFHYLGVQNYSKTRTKLEGRWIGADNPADKADAWDAIQRFNAQQTSRNAKIERGDLMKKERAAKRQDADTKAKGLPPGTRPNKRVPELTERARATFNY